MSVYLPLFIGVGLGFFAGVGTGMLYIEYSILTAIKKILKSIEVESKKFKDDADRKV